VLACIPDYVFWKDRTGVYQGCNENYARIAGVERPENIQGRSMDDLPWAIEERDALHKDDVLCIETGEYVRNREQIVTLLDGTKKTFLVSKAPLTSIMGTVTGIIGTFVDITDRKEIEAEREALLEELGQKNKELESIIYVASHDLRSPLVNIQGFGQRLEKIRGELLSHIQEATDIEIVRSSMLSTLEDRMPRALGFIRASAEKMDILIGGLLRLSRTGRAILNPEILNIKEMIDTILASMAFQIQAAGALVDIGDLPPCIADSAQVNQVFSNLLDNALKYRDPERPLILSISGQEESCEVVYCVSDTGKGVAKEHIENIWGLFHRLEPNGAVAGEGLGLTLVRRIVERHKGRAWAESELGEGTRFYVALPRQKKA